MKHLTCILASLAVSVFLPGQAASQGARDQLLRQAIAAYDDLQHDRALELLHAAVNPAGGPTDQVWASAVQFLAQVLVEQREDSLAAVWLRWALRLKPDMAVDSIRFLPTVVTAFHAARIATAQGTLQEAGVETVWEWSPAASPRGTGVLRVEATGGTTPVRVFVSGVGVVAPAQVSSLRPGTYEIQAAAERYLTTQLAREVLPGVTTLVRVRLMPQTAAASVPDSVLPAAVAATVSTKVATLALSGYGGGQRCSVGFVAGSRGLVVTTYSAIRGAESVQVAFSDGSRMVTGVTVAAHDVSQNLALLSLPPGPGDPLALRSDVRDGEHVWSLAPAGCEPSPTATRLRLARWSNRPAGDLELTEPGAAVGAALVDQTGRVVGVGAGSVSALPAARISDILRRAEENLRAGAPALTLRQVAEQEKHRYGSLELRTAVPDALARLTPLEPWHWPELAFQGALPLTVTAPMGRYQAELLTGGAAGGSQTVTIEPGVTRQVLLTPAAAPLPPSQPQPESPRQGPPVARRSRGFPWPIAVGVGVVGAGAVAYLLTRPTTGTITISVTVP